MQIRFQTHDSKFNAADALVPANEAVVLRLALHNNPYFSTDEFLCNYDFLDQRAIIEGCLLSGAVSIHHTIGAAGLENIDKAFRVKAGLTVTHNSDFIVAIISRASPDNAQRYIYGYTVYDKDDQNDVFMKLDARLRLSLDQTPPPTEKANPHHGIHFIPARRASLVYKASPAKEPARHAAPAAAAKLASPAAVPSAKLAPAPVTPAPMMSHAVSAAAMKEAASEKESFAAKHHLTELVHNNFVKLEIDDSKPIPLTINGETRDYLPINGNVIVTQTPVVHVCWYGEKTSQWTTLDPDSNFLKAYYRGLKSSIESSAKLTVEQTLKKTMKFVKTSFGYDPSVDYTDRVKAMTLEYKSQNCIIPLPDFIIMRVGVCRHYALFTAYLINRLIEDGLLPPGHAYFHRDDIIHSDGTNGRHAWVVFKPDVLPHYYWIDSFWRREEAFKLPNEEAAIRARYGDPALQECKARYQAPAAKATAAVAAPTAPAKVAPHAALMPPAPGVRASVAAVAPHAVLMPPVSNVRAVNPAAATRPVHSKLAGSR